MKMYSMQILMLSGFLGEAILNGTTSWFFIFGVLLFGITFYNGYNEFQDAFSTKWETQGEKE